MDSSCSDFLFDLPWSLSLGRGWYWWMRPLVSWSPRRFISPCKLISWPSIYVLSVSMGLEIMIPLLRDFFFLDEHPSSVCLCLWEWILSSVCQWGDTLKLLLWGTHQPFSTLCIMEIKMYTFKAVLTLFFWCYVKTVFTTCYSVFIFCKDLVCLLERAGGGGKERAGGDG